MKKLLIFDFDGTIADTMEVMYKIYVTMAEKYNMPILSKDDLQAYKKLPLKERLSRQGIPFYMVPKILSESQSMQLQFLEDAKPFEGIHELLHTLKKHFSLVIVSSNRKSFIKPFLKKHDLMVFDKIYGKAQLFGKADTIQKAIKKEKAHIETSLYLGDETRDLMACQELNLDMIAVSYGYDDKSLLENEGAKVIVDRPVDLLKSIKEF